MDSESSHIPRGDWAGLRANWKPDLVSGFLVFLIALPLCLGISLACGYPAIAGIFTAIIGGILGSAFSNSELTIKGPAAGLIVIAIGCVTDFGFTDGRDPEADFQAYRMALGVGVAAGVIQILLGVFRTGILGEFFPTTAIHGLLASIGIIIIAKQFPVTMGLHAKGGPLELLANIPHFIVNMNPVLGLIGLLSLIILFTYPFYRDTLVGNIPAPMIVLLLMVPLGMYFQLGESRSYLFQGKEFHLGPEFLVNVPQNMFNALTFPDFSGLATATGWKYVMMFALIGSLESLLSSKAIDGIDPWGRKTNMDRDLLAVGIGNTICSFVGGLPMISEIVRSKANIDNGGRTRFSNLFHGLLLLAFVALVPGLINQIPLAALGAMLVFTGFRLASPMEFVHIYRMGKDQFLVFISTIIGVLATDLLTGIAIGIGVKALIHLINGAPLRSFFRLNVEISHQDEQTVTIKVKDSAIFSTWIPLRKFLNQYLQEGKNVILYFGDTRLVDHTVMSKLYEWIMEYEEKDLELSVRGLGLHEPLSDHIVAAHKRRSEAAEM